jgi:hypothetical protein
VSVDFRCPAIPTLSIKTGRRPGKERLESTKVANRIVSGLPFSRRKKYFLSIDLIVKITPSAITPD